MKFNIRKENILGELQMLQGIVEKRNTMPILANILIKAENNQLEITGTDLEVGLITRFPAEIEEQGAITISGKKTYEIIRFLKEDQDISFEVIDNSTMKITSGASEFKVLCLPEEDYPQVPLPKFEKKIRLPLEEFKIMIERVFYAITQEQRYYLNGALLLLRDNKLELVSTDGHRLSYTKLKIDNMNVEDEIRGIVSKKTLNELRHFDDEFIEFDLDENNLYFRVENRILISRIIEGKFPNFEAVIPRENKNILSVSTEELKDAIRRVSLLSTERSKGIKFFIKQSQLGLFSSNPEIGEAKDQLNAEYEGAEYEIGFNSQYLLDFLGTVKSEKVRFEIKDDNNAVLIKPTEADEIEYLYVLMPMKI